MIQAATESVQQKELRLVLAAQAGSEAAFGELIEMHKRFIWLQAKKTIRFGVEIEDLVQVGMQVLVRGIRLFKPEKNCRLLTFVGLGIRHQMWRAAVVTSEDRVGGTLDTHDMQTLHPGRECPVRELERREDIRRIRRSLKDLPPRMKDVVKARMRGETLDVIGARMGISKERVRQLENVAHAKIRESLMMGGAA